MTTPVQGATGASIPANESGFGLQAASKGKPDSRPNYTYGVTPGAKFADQVAVVNLGNKPLTVDLYSTDATTTSDGSFALLTAAQKPSQVGTWIKLDSAPTITIPARTATGPSYKVVNFHVAIPQNAMPGDHAGGILVSLDAKAATSKGVNVNLQQRVVYRVYVRVSGAVRGGLSIQNLKITYHHPPAFGNPFAKGSVTLSYEVQNSGNVILGVHQAIKVSSLLTGVIHARGLSDIPPLLPGGSINVSEVVPGIFPGVRVSATVTLAPIVPANSVDPHIGSVSRTVSVWAQPYELEGFVVLAILLAVALWFFRIRPLRARKKAGLGPKHTKGPKAKVGVSA